jgi:hypothetical protein
MENRNYETQCVISFLLHADDGTRVTASNVALDRGPEALRDMILGDPAGYGWLTKQIKWRGRTSRTIAAAYGRVDWQDVCSALRTNREY